MLAHDDSLTDRTCPVKAQPSLNTAPMKYGVAVHAPHGLAHRYRLITYATDSLFEVWSW